MVSGADLKERFMMDDTSKRWPFKKCDNPASFCSIAFLSNNIFTMKNFSSVRTGIVRVKGEQADHFTPTTIAKSNFLMHFSGPWNCRLINSHRGPSVKPAAAFFALLKPKILVLFYALNKSPHTERLSTYLTLTSLSLSLLFFILCLLWTILQNTLLS